jgi:hypothetical protein
MFNNTSKVLPYSGQTVGVILPHSEKILNAQDLDKKITKVKGHIEHLTAQQPHRNTHGGKAFRAKRISLQNQIALASDRLHLLQSAKATINQRIQLEKELTAVSLLVHGQAPESYSYGPSSTVMFGGSIRKISVIKTHYATPERNLPETGPAAHSKLILLPMNQPTHLETELDPDWLYC